MTLSTLNPTILRENDIRGIAGTELTEQDAYTIGRAFAAHVQEANGKTIAVGRDGRVSSKSLEDALIRGLSEGGLKIFHVGLSSTPMLLFAEKTLPTDAAIMVTASHNPPDYNGFKMSVGGEPLLGDQIRALGARSIEPIKNAPETSLTRVGESIFTTYQVALLARFLSRYPTENAQSLKIAWDPGHGASGPIVEALVKVLPGEHHVIHAKIDGTFPAHPPDPIEVENLKDLQALVAKEGCDFGLAFDGDGDRVALVDGKGRPFFGDQLMILFAEEVLAEMPNATIIADVKASQVLFDEIQRLGGQPLMWRTGRSLIKAKMREVESVLAGEMSGHIFFQEWYDGIDDAVYSALRLIGAAGQSPQSMTARWDAMPKAVNTPELRIACAEDKKFKIVEQIRSRVRSTGASIIDIDGVRVIHPNGWWLLRASNTQSALVARAEARTEGHLASLKEELRAYLQAFEVAVSF